MNEDRIKKALECCDSHIPSACGDCPYCCIEECKDELITSALNLITEQEKDYSKLQEMFANYQLASDKEIRAQVKQAKIDVLNELKGRVRTSYVLDDFILGNVVFSKDIDELIEEVENEKKD